jgi:hypothetical protein
MSRRGLSSESRIVAALIAATFALAAIGGPLGLYACHLHRADSDAPASTEHAHHGGHGEASHEQTGSDADRCSCVGLCTATLGASLPSASLSVRLGFEVVRTTTAATLVAAPRWYLQYLPFSTGPPALRV